MTSKIASIKDANVVKLPTKTDKLSDQKWGRSVMKLGFCMIPSLLLRAQQRLGLNPTQLAVLLQLADFWWEAGRKPFPSKQALSERLGIGSRQVQRHLADLESAGLIERIERRSLNKGKLSNEYDLSGLVNKLKKIAPEIEEANEIRKQSTRKGGLKNYSLVPETKKPA